MFGFGILMTRRVMLGNQTALKQKNKTNTISNTLDNKGRKSEACTTKLDLSSGR